MSIAAAQPETTAELRQLVIFTLDSEHYAVPISEVKEVVKDISITIVPNSPAFILGVVNLRGKIVPIIDIEQLFGLHRDTAIPSQTRTLIVENTDHSLFGVRVDRVTEIIKIAPDTIQPAPAMVTARISQDYIEGVIVIPRPSASGSDNDVLLLLSLQKIITQEVMSAVKAAVAQPEAALTPVEKEHQS